MQEEAPSHPTYFPAWQLVHEDEPTLEKVPFSQAVHVRVSASLVYLPAMHEVQASCPSNPPLVFPEEQTLQLFCPAAPWYFPFSQLVQEVCPLKAEYAPGAQDSQAAAPEELEVPLLQSVHDSLPELLYFPASQLAQASLFSKDFLPASQSSQELEPELAELFVPAGQSPQLTEPSEEVKAPEEQGVQAAVPLTSSKLL